VPDFKRLQKTFQQTLEEQKKQKKDEVSFIYQKEDEFQQEAEEDEK
jgi:hypothetical protein